MPPEPQPQLFDPATVERPRCRACGARAKNLCRHDADIEHGTIVASARRPKSCLNQYDPRTAPFPY